MYMRHKVCVVETRGVYVYIYTYMALTLTSWGEICLRQGHIEQITRDIPTSAYRVYVLYQVDAWFPRIVWGS